MFVFRLLGVFDVSYSESNKIKIIKFLIGPELGLIGSTKLIANNSKYMFMCNCEQNTA